MTFAPIGSIMSQAPRASKIRGVWPAVVVDNRDGDSNPGFRVRVKFPWLNEQETTSWARIAIPMGGRDRGTYVLPEIDDQVLVVFEHGDIGRPIVIGGLWSKKQEPVEVNDSGNNNTKLIKSRCGHRVIFDDKDGAEKITIVDKSKKNKIVLDSANKIVKIESDGEIGVIAKANVIMHANALKMGTREGLAGKASTLLVHAAKTFSVKATSGITIGGGNTTINTSNAAACSVSGAGAGELGGAPAEQPKAQRADVEELVDGNSDASSGAAGPVNATSGNPSQTHSTQSDDEQTHTVDFTVVYPDGTPADGLGYALVGPGGERSTGRLGADGKVHKDGARDSVWTLELQAVDEASWSTPRVRAGEPVRIIARTSGCPDGAPVRVRVFRQGAESDDEVLEERSASVQSDRLQVDYQFDDSGARASWTGEVLLLAEVAIDGAVWAKTPPLTVALKTLAAARWIPATADDGANVELVVGASGYPDGATLTAELWACTYDGGNRKLGDLPKANVSGERTRWTLACTRAADPDAHPWQDGTLCAAGEYYVVVRGASPSRVLRTPRLVVSWSKP